MKGGKPIRFLGLTLVGWTGLRAIALWPSAEPLQEAVRHLGITSATANELVAPRITTTARPPHSTAIAALPAPIEAMRRPAGAQPTTAQDAAPPPPHVAAATHRIVPGPSLPPPFVPVPLAAPPRRFAGSAWLIARGGANPALLGGQLGASQAGVRVTYTLDRGHRLALAARLATPLRSRGREAAIGLDWQPTRAPLHVVAEQRFFLDGGQGGPSVSVIGGIGPAALRHGLVVEAYGQAGAIARDRLDGFADGLARVSHPVARLHGMRLDLGVGAWGGAQRGAGRLDIGPSLALAIPVAGKALRVTADWRERIAGHAQPGSGPALSVGSDF